MHDAAEFKRIELKTTEKGDWLNIELFLLGFLEKCRVTGKSNINMEDLSKKLYECGINSTAIEKIKSMASLQKAGMKLSSNGLDLHYLWLWMLVPKAAKCLDLLLIFQ
jgi:hypothetical protein